MAVLTSPTAPLSPSLHQAAGPSCSLQRVAPQGAPGNSGALWQLGIEAQELPTAIGQLAEQLEADDDDSRAQSLAELEAALLAEEGNKQALAAKAVAERFRAAVATCWVIEHLRGQAAYRQQQAKRLTELSRSDASRADALEDSLVLVLTRLQPTSTRFSFPNHELTSRKSQAVEIENEDTLDPQWLSFSTTSKPDKAAIKEALKAGTEITGAQLISRRSWRIH
ncbi:MAG: siphovirus Gp157 family protein [Synechococcaceae cyanobacterium]